MIKTRENLNIRDITYIGIFISLIVVCSWVSIPFTIPFTLQTFAIFTTIYLLGTRKSFLAILVYILLGAIGLPVFSNFKSGISTILGPTGGYILGFLITSLVTGSLIKHFPKKTVFSVFSMIVGLILCYIFGTTWFMYFYTKSSGTITLFKALSLCVFPFIIPDLAKIALSVIITKRLENKINL